MARPQILAAPLRGQLVQQTAPFRLRLPSTAGRESTRFDTIRTKRDHSTTGVPMLR